jgi:ferredoxin
LSNSENCIIVAPMETEVEGQPATATEVTIELDGKVATTTHHPGTTLLQTARQVGLRPPSSCEAGNCATCMARVVEGTATMVVNDALEDDEVAEGWVLTCQAIPTSPTISVVYGF